MKSKDSSVNGKELNSPSVRSYRILLRDREGELQSRPDPVSVEEPLEIRLGKDSLAVTMRTPGHDRELTAGFLATEAIIDSPDQIKEISPCQLPGLEGNIWNVVLQSGVEVSCGVMSRYGTISSSCGLCGKVSIEEIFQRFDGVEDKKKILVDESVIQSLPDKLREAQRQFDSTGGLHAAALFDKEGELLWLREDVGRHNAVDKVLGQAFLEGQWPLSEHLLMVSGRTSFEILQKSLAAEVPILCSVSAPSSLAVDFAQRSGQTLIGFLRPPGFNLYSHVYRVKLEP